MLRILLPFALSLLASVPVCGQEIRQFIPTGSTIRLDGAWRICRGPGAAAGGVAQMLRHATLTLDDRDAHPLSGPVRGYFSAPCRDEDARLVLATWAGMGKSQRAELAAAFDLPPGWVQRLRQDNQAYAIRVREHPRQILVVGDRQAGLQYGVVDLLRASACPTGNCADRRLWAAGQVLEYPDVPVRVSQFKSEAALYRDWALAQCADDACRRNRELVDMMVWNKYTHFWDSGWKGVDILRDRAGLGPQVTEADVASVWTYLHQRRVLPTTTITGATDNPVRLDAAIEGIGSQDLRMTRCDDGTHSWLVPADGDKYDTGDCQVAPLDMLAGPGILNCAWSAGWTPGMDCAATSGLRVGPRGQAFCDDAAACAGPTWCTGAAGAKLRIAHLGFSDGSANLNRGRTYALRVQAHKTGAATAPNLDFFFRPPVPGTSTRQSIGQAAVSPQQVSYVFTYPAGFSGDGELQLLTAGGNGPFAERVCLDLSTLELVELDGLLRNPKRDADSGKSSVEVYDCAAPQTAYAEGVDWELVLDQAKGGDFEPVFDAAAGDLAGDYYRIRLLNPALGGDLCVRHISETHYGLAAPGAVDSYINDWYDPDYWRDVCSGPGLPEDPCTRRPVDQMRVLDDSGLAELMGEYAFIGAGLSETDGFNRTGRDFRKGRRVDAGHHYADYAWKMAAAFGGGLAGAAPFGAGNWHASLPAGPWYDFAWTGADGGQDPLAAAAKTPVLFGDMLHSFWKDRHNIVGGGGPPELMSDALERRLLPPGVLINNWYYLDHHEVLVDIIDNTWQGGDGWVSFAATWKDLENMWLWSAYAAAEREALAGVIHFWEPAAAAMADELSHIARKEANADCGWNARYGLREFWKLDGTRAVAGGFDEDGDGAVDWSTDGTVTDGHYDPHFVAAPTASGVSLASGQHLQLAPRALDAEWAGTAGGETRLRFHAKATFAADLLVEARYRDAGQRPLGEPAAALVGVGPAPAWRSHVVDLPIPPSAATVEYRLVAWAGGALEVDGLAFMQRTPYTGFLAHTGSGTCPAR